MSQASLTRQIAEVERELKERSLKRTRDNDYANESMRAVLSTLYWLEKHRAEFLNYVDQVKEKREASSS